jgi:hypothetical protein
MESAGGYSPVGLGTEIWRFHGMCCVVDPQEIEGEEKECEE